MKKLLIIPLIICSFFFLAYAALGIIKHNHFLSGYDLSVADQVVWKYSRFNAPITTIHSYAFTPLLYDHVELIYAFLSPFYWIWNDPRMLIILQAFFLSFSAIPVYLLAKRRGISTLLASTLCISYLLFFGIQNALWNDVHSNVFGAGFLMWFIYFLENNNLAGIGISFLLTVACKEDMALLTFLVAFVYFVIHGRHSYPNQTHPGTMCHPSPEGINKNISSSEEKHEVLQLKNEVQGRVTAVEITILLMVISLLYLFLVFVIYYPHFTPGYRFHSKEGLFADFNPTYYIDTAAKRESIVYSLASFGFLPLLAPLFLLPALGDTTHYFLFGRAVTAAQEIFLHYRVTLAPLLLLPTIYALGKLRKLHPVYPTLYLLFFAFVLQYHLHLPLSYFTKQWFWHEPPSVQRINHVLQYLPDNASVVSQNNITPHIAHRDLVFTLWSDKKTFHWSGNPKYLLIDTSPDWDARHFLTSRENFLEALQNLEKEKVIVMNKQYGTAKLYRVIKQP